MKYFPNIEDYKKQFFKGTIIPDESYLNTHYPRFKMTWEFIWKKTDTIKTMLDIGAHWLHQSIVYAKEGVDVTAAELPTTLNTKEVQSVAEEYNINLISYLDLSKPEIFDKLPENHFDLILFAEIIEHITFNPVDMWRAIFRVMKPGGRIILTTPNYYHLGGRAWDIKRYLFRSGGGITSKEILNVPTYGPHWKEFSAKEIRDYFTMLSPDFDITEIKHASIPYSLPVNLSQKFKCKLEDWLPFLRNNLFVEVTLYCKDVGIVIDPCWSKPVGA